MGLVFVKLGVANLAQRENVEFVECMVDSGASFSVIARAVLDKLGIEPYRKDSFGLANGVFIERERGVAMFTYEDRMGISDVLFGELGDANLLGVVTLEQMGLVLDPFRRELKVMPLVLGGFPRGLDA